MSAQLADALNGSVVIEIVGMPPPGQANCKWCGNPMD